MPSRSPPDRVASGWEATQRPLSARSMGNVQPSHSAANPQGRVAMEVSIGRWILKWQRRLMAEELAHTG